MRPLAPLACATLLLTACAPASNGSLRVFANGEEAAEGGYPTPGPEPIAFADGWTMTFDHVLIGLSDFTVDGAVLAVDPVVIDLHEGRAELFTEMALPPGRAEIGYSFAVVQPSFVAIGAVDAAARGRMEAAGASLYIEGTATHETHGTYTFELALPRGVVASECEQADGTLGIVVPENGVAEGDVTVHLDHLFFDSATAEEPALRFEAWAAVAGDDRRVTMDELATQDLADLIGVDGMPLDDGGALVAYEPPATGLPSLDLRAYVLAQAITMPHWMGEGHCSYR